MNRRRFCAGLFAALFGSSSLSADTATESTPSMPSLDFDPTLLLSKTAGGKQFWADVWFYHEYRIQCHALDNHYRLLDGADRRLASGTFDACRDRLDEIRKENSLPAMEGKALVLLHGLFRTRSAMSTLSKSIGATGNYKTFCMGYPTTRGSVDSHARSLDSVVRSLEGMSEISFVAHSLGNLVVRHWLHNLNEEKRSLPKGQAFGRMVMLTPPNRQPEIATKLIRGALANFVAGPAAQQLATGWEGLETKLATPTFEFGVLAGGRGDDKGFNPLVTGDDDGVITVESTRLTGARDFRILPVLHTFFMDDSRVQEMTLRFLEKGYFESDEKRKPIAAG